MIKDIVNILKDVSLRHKGVYTFRYQGKSYNNAQNNYKIYQVYLEDTSMHQLNITSGIFKAEFQLWILAQPTEESGNTIIDVQNNAYTIACDIMAYIDSKEEYHGILSVYDYSILVLSHYSDDDSAGVKLSLVLEMPNPTNMCTLEDNFDDEPHEEEQDKEITISGNTVTEDLTITPIRLPRNRQC